MVYEPVKQGGGEGGVGEDFHPARQVQIRSDAETAALVHLGTELEQQYPARPKAEIPELAEDDEVEGLPVPEVAWQAIFGLGGEQLRAASRPGQSPPHDQQLPPLAHPQDRMKCQTGLSTSGDGLATAMASEAL